MGFTLYLLLTVHLPAPKQFCEGDYTCQHVWEAEMAQMLEFAPLKLKFIISSTKLLMEVKMVTLQFRA